MRPTPNGVERRPCLNESPSEKEGKSAVLEAGNLLEPAAAMKERSCLLT